MLNSFKEFLLTFITSVLASFDSMLASAENILVNGGGIDLWDEIIAFSAILHPFCYTIIAICLLIEIAKTASKVDIIKWEHGLKVALKMVISKVAIDTAPAILKAIYATASYWTQQASVASFGGGATITNLGATVNAGMSTMINGLSGWGSVLGLFMSLLVVVVAIKICGLIIQVIAFGRIFEIYVYLAVSPIPMAFLPLGDGSGGGFSRITGKFFKAFAGICLQSLLMIISIRLFGLIMVTTINDAIATAIGTGGSTGVSDLCYTMLLGCIVLVMAVVKSGGWAKSIMDAV